MYRHEYDGNSKPPLISSSPSSGSKSPFLSPPRTTGTCTGICTGSPGGSSLVAATGFLHDFPLDKHWKSSLNLSGLNVSKTEEIATSIHFEFKTSNKILCFEAPAKLSSSPVTNRSRTSSHSLIDESSPSQDASPRASRFFF